MTRQCGIRKEIWKWIICDVYSLHAKTKSATQKYGGKWKLRVPFPESYKIWYYNGTAVYTEWMIPYGQRGYSDRNRLAGEGEERKHLRAGKNICKIPWSITFGGSVERTGGNHINVIFIFTYKTKGKGERRIRGKQRRGNPKLNSTKGFDHSQ